MTDIVDNNPDEAAFRAAVFPALKEQYAPHLKELFEQHCFRAKKVTENDRINFLWEFDQIISGYKNRINDPEYFARMASCRTALSQAAELLGASVDNLIKLDSHHLLGLAKTVEAVAPRQLLMDIASPKSAIELFDMFSILKKAGVLALVLSAGLSLTGGNDLLPPGRGNQPLPYLLPTVDLIDFWKRWTGQEVPYAKAFPHEDEISGGEPAQAASAFIRFALTLIDPEVTNAKAITSINNAREARKLLLDEISRVPTGPDSLRQYVQSLTDKI